MAEAVDSVDSDNNEVILRNQLILLFNCECSGAIDRGKIEGGILRTVRSSSESPGNAIAAHIGGNNKMGAIKTDFMVLIHVLYIT